MTRSARRPGTTLMEVLIATFIMSIGMLAILALFPIGAVNFARAINQDRSTTHGVNSNSVFSYYWAQAWRHPVSGDRLTTSAEAYGYSQEPMIYLLDHHSLYPTLPPTVLQPGLSTSQPGFPVLVDPVGWQTNIGTNNQYWIGGLQTLPMRTTLRRCINVNNGYASYPPGPFPQPIQYAVPPGDMAPGIPVNPPYPTIIPASIRLTTLLDDMTFDNSGQPAVPAAQLERGGRYNVAWLIRRPRNNVPDEVELKVLVYAGRSPTDTPSPEHVFPNATTEPGQKLIQIPLGGQPVPPLRKGAWIALSRVIGVPPVIDPATGQPTFTPYPTFDFYRVAGVNDDAADPLLVELESPIRAEGPPPPAGPAVYTGTVVVFENLVEVFDRGMVSAAGGAGR